MTIRTPVPSASSNRAPDLVGPPFLSFLRLSVECSPRPQAPGMSRRLLSLGCARIPFFLALIFSPDLTPSTGPEPVYSHRSRHASHARASASCLARRRSVLCPGTLPPDSCLLVMRFVLLHQIGFIRNPRPRSRVPLCRPPQPINTLVAPACMRCPWAHRFSDPVPEPSPRMRETHNASAAMPRPRLLSATSSRFPPPHTSYKFSPVEAHSAPPPLPHPDAPSATYPLSPPCLLTYTSPPRKVSRQIVPRLLLSAAPALTPS